MIDRFNIDIGAQARVSRGCFMSGVSPGLTKEDSGFLNKIILAMSKYVKITRQDAGCMVPRETRSDGVRI